MATGSRLILVKWHKSSLAISTNGKGLYDITAQINSLISNWGVMDGICYLYCPHTSASLLINENYDETVKQDITTFFERLVPESQAWMKHSFEGPDDSSSHLRSALLPPSQMVPIENGSLALGTWQGIFLFEHRSHSKRRTVIIRVLDVTSE